MEIVLGVCMSLPVIMWSDKDPHKMQLLVIFAAKLTCGGHISEERSCKGTNCDVGRCLESMSILLLGGLGNIVGHGSSNAAMRIMSRWRSRYLYMYIDNIPM